MFPDVHLEVLASSLEIALSAGATAHAERAFRNRVATFNVCNHCNDPRPVSRIPPRRRPQLIAEEIAKYRPQVIGLQEI